jgi:transposase
MRQSVSVFDVKNKRELWHTQITQDMAKNLVFLDESGVNTNMTRRYGRSLSSERVADHAPLNTPKTTTILSSIRLSGEKAYTTYQGGITGERFVTYLKKVLIPTLHKDDIVVMDNLRSHHVKKVTELLQQNYIAYVYLPPYSPDLNPIEKMWSKMKSILRKRKVRKQDDLKPAIHDALDRVTQTDVLHWFTASGYCL